jgi:hypothetical protein
MFRFPAHARVSIDRSGQVLVETSTQDMVPGREHDSATDSGRCAGRTRRERSETDPGLGRFLSKNLSGYLVPVNADVPEIDASFVEEFDPHASPLGARGIGELGAIGVGPAIANAVFHATGVRVREVPIRPEHLLEPSDDASDRRTQA